MEATPKNNKKPFAELDLNLNLRNSHAAGLNEAQVMRTPYLDKIKPSKHKIKEVLDAAHES